MNDIRHLFESDYPGTEKFLTQVLRPVFGEYEKGYDNLTSDKEMKEKARSANIEKIEHSATFDFYGSGLKIFDVTVSDEKKLENNRVGIQSIVRQYIEQFEGALIVFHHKNVENQEWRLSYVEKRTNAKDTTSARRYTYILGKGHPAKTITERFKQLKEKQGLVMKDLTEAFSVEPLSKEFFDEYREKYADLVEYISGTRYVKKGGKFVEEKTKNANPQFKSQFENDDKAVRDYVKKMMGRLVFLHFLQKKGWLGVKKDEEWGTGDKNFFYNLFTSADEKIQNDFLEQVLEPLFFNTLNRNRGKEAIAPKPICDIYGREIRIPYLNGGLFEEDELDKKKVKFKKEHFEELLEFFSQYNFTIDETDSDDTEIGVDPEMLGKIFENLLEDNKDKGAFYTPKEIVQYMCRESLVAYLANETAIEESALHNFVITHNAQNFTSKEKADIFKALTDVKVCDPAVGSGAFPMGMLNELFACRIALEEKEKNSEIRKQIVCENIYGVDIEKGAVDIARLRFWLAIIVDEKDPLPLPNLDYKIMQGNSLLESFDGIDLSNLCKADETLLFEDSSEIRTLLEFLQTYFDTHEEKSAIRDSIKATVFELLKNRGFSTENNRTIEKLEKLNLHENSEFFLWHTWFHDVFNRPQKQGGTKSGFDIVIGNPPYVEARNGIFSEKLKDELQENMIRIYGNSSNVFFPRGADILIFFFELSFRLINSNGIISLITQNSWLNSDYGKKFQNYIQTHTNILGIVDSDFKYFENANINTVITFFKGMIAGEKISYARCHENLKNESFSITEENKIYSSTDVKIFDTKNLLLGDYKWGLLFFSDDTFIDLLTRANAKGEKLFENINGLSIGQGLNTTKNNFSLKERNGYVPILSKEDGAIFNWWNPKIFVKKSEISKDRKRPVLILPRGIGSRYYCAYNSAKGYSNSCVEIYSNNENFDTVLRLWLFCNSSFCWLMRENSGRKNLGGGMLKSEATDMKLMPLLYNFEIDAKVKTIFETAKTIEISTDIREVLANPIHRKIDDIVFSFLEFDERERNYVIEKLISEIELRNKKSRN